MRFCFSFVLLFFVAATASAENGCVKPYLLSSDFAALTDEAKQGELDRLALGLGQGCDVALVGLNYLSVVLPADQTKLLKWYRLLVEISESKSKQVHTQKKLIDQFLNRIQETSEKLERAQKTIARWVPERARLEAELASVAAEREASLVEVKALAKQIEEDSLSRVALSTSEAKMRTVVAALEADIAKLHEEIAELKSKNLVLHQDILDENEVSEGLREEVEAREMTIAALLEEIRELKAILDEKNAEIGDLLGFIDDLKSSITAQAAVHALLVGVIDEKNAEINRRDAEIAARDVTIERLLAELEAANNRIADLEAELDQAKAVIIEQGLKIEELLAENARLKAENAGLTTENEELRTKLKLLGERYDEVIAALDMLKEDHQRLEGKQIEIHQDVIKLNEFRLRFFARLDELLSGVDGITVEKDKVKVQTDVLFETGSTTISPEARVSLALIAQHIVEFDSILPEDLTWFFQINGHSDVQKILKGSKYRDNWQLSTERALGVLEVLVSNGSPPEHLVAAGYGSFQPVKAGGTPEDLAANRRIELRITN